MASKRAAPKPKGPRVPAKAKALDCDVAMFTRAETSILTDKRPTCLTGERVPTELIPSLIADKKPRYRCAHCGTMHAAFHAPDPATTTCSCLCHAARRYDMRPR